jgi:hypothetical protein
MAKYFLKTYGWEMESVAHSLTDDQVEQIQTLIEENEYDSLSDCRWDLEEQGIIEDFYGGDLIFHMSAAMDNGTLNFVIEDEQGNTVLEFDSKQTTDIYTYFGEGVDPDTEFPHIGYVAIPEETENIENIIVLFDENKGGIAQYVFESDEVPVIEDFAYMTGSVDTPDGDWDFMSRVFFKKKELEVDDHLDNRGKASTLEIYRKSGENIY